MNNQLPVYDFIGNNNVPILHSVVLQPGMTYYDAVTGNQLSKPPTKGDLRPDGVKYHVGERYENIVSYHGHGWNNDNYQCNHQHSFFSNNKSH